MISSVGPIALFLTSIFFFVYFIWSVRIDRKLKNSESSTSICTLTSSQINSKYVGDIFGIIISFLGLFLSGWLLVSTYKENGTLFKLSNRFRRSKKD